MQITWTQFTTSFIAVPKPCLPWEMVLIIHGFPNEISALRFEWAWQNPQLSRRLKTVIRAKKRNETHFEYKFSVVVRMLQTSPWKRLPLTIRWLKQEYRLQFDPLSMPPVHMPVIFGPVVSKKVTNDVSSSSQANCTSKTENAPRCAVCDKLIEPGDDRLSCLLSTCPMASHTCCLARHFLHTDDQLLPIDGHCPCCDSKLLWGDLIRYKLGCYQTETLTLPESEIMDETVDWTEQL